MEQDTTAREADAGILEDLAILVDDIRPNVAVIIREYQDLAPSYPSTSVARMHAPCDRLFDDLHRDRRSLSEALEKMRCLVRGAVVHDDQLPIFIAANRAHVVEAPCKAAHTIARGNDDGDKRSTEVPVYPGSQVPRLRHQPTYPRSLYPTLSQPPAGIAAS